MLENGELSVNSLLTSLEAATSNSQKNEFSNKFLIEDYEKYITAFGSAYFNSQHELDGYFYILNDGNNFISKYYGFSKKNNLDLELNRTVELINLVDKNSNKWFVSKSLLDYNNHLIYIKPIKYNKKQDIGYFGIIMNLNFVKDSLFISDTNTAYNYTLLNTATNINDKIDNKIDDKVVFSTYSPNQKQLNCFNRLLKLNLTDKNKITYFQSGFNCYVAKPVADNLVLIQETNLANLQLESNFSIIFLMVSLLFCFFVQQSDNNRPNSILTSYVEKLENKLFIHPPALGNLKRKVYLTILVCLLGLVLLSLFYLLFTSHDILPSVMSISIMVFTLIYFKLYLVPIESKTIRMWKSVFRFITPLLPGIFLIMSKPSTTFNTILSFTWILIIVIINLFHNDRFKSILVNYLMLSSIFVCQLLSVFIYKRFPDPSELVSLSVVVFISLIINSIFIVHRNAVEKHNSDMKSIVDKLKDTQSALIQNEKMATLGQLISGIAHEINTPIGAIKATADTFNLKLVQSIKDTIELIKDFGEEEQEILFHLIELSFECVKSMKTTSEIRSAKEDNYDYLVSEGFDDDTAYSIAHQLSRLEICDQEQIKELLPALRHNNIENILDTACGLFYLITGTNTIHLATNKVSKIVYALRAYSNVSISNNTDEFNVIECIDNILTLYASQFNSSITINRVYPNNLPNIIGNSEGLGQVFTNIIQNAFYAMKDNGGALTITIKFDTANMYLTFADTGCGIPDEYLPKIFDPLFTTKPLGEGSGLGLGICKKIIDSHSGSIEVKSELEKGSTFFITLPLTQPT